MTTLPLPLNRPSAPDRAVDPTPDRFAKLSLIQVIFVCSLGLSSVALGATFRLSQLGRVSFLICGMMIGAVVFEELSEVGLEVRRYVQLSWLSVASVAWVFPQLADESHRWVLIIGDAAQILMFAIVAIVPAPFLRIAHNRSAQRILLSFMAVAALLGPTIAEVSNRYNPPQYLMIAVAVVLLTRRTRPIVSLASFCAFGALVFLSFDSGNRLAFLAAFVALVVAWMMRFEPSLRLLIVSVSAVVLLAVAPVLASAGAEAAEGTRFSSLANGELDQSSAGRLDEVRDISSRISDRWAVVNYLVGEGHGAQYRPILSTTIEKTREDGLFHAVHIGAARYFFRYGIIGLVIAVVAQGILLKKVLLAPSGQNLVNQVFLVAALMVLADNQVRNSLLDPSNALILALAFSGILGAAVSGSASGHTSD